MHQRAYRFLMARLRNHLFLVYVTTRPLGYKKARMYRKKTWDEGCYRMKLASREDMLAAVPDFPDQLNEEEIHRVFDQGDVCLGAFDGDRLVAFTFRCYSKAQHEPGIYIHVNKPYRYGYKAFTHPEYRGQRLFDASIADPICRSKGFNQSLGFIETHNYSSMKRSRRNGNRIVGMAGYFKLFGKVFAFRSSGAKQFGFAFVPET